jgi:phosphatidylserine synthase
VKGRATRAAANLATLGNALLGVGAILYTLAGNKLWGMLLVVIGMGFDGLDGILSRRSGLPSGTSGRVFDSVADAVTFALAPAVFLAVSPEHRELWAAVSPLPIVAAVVFATFALVRLGYFTARGHVHPHFVGASTPQTAFAVILLLLFADTPGYLGANPVVVLGGAIALSPLMVLPVRYPKIRRGAKLRRTMTLTSIALAVALVPAQFRPPVGSPLYWLSLSAAVASAIGLAVYYSYGPRSVEPDEEGTEWVAAHA